MSDRKSDLSIVPLGPFASEGAPTSIDARCARFGLSWPSERPLCCARGALIDGRARIELVARVTLRWSSEGPMQHGPAPSGIVERLDDVPFLEGVSCAAFDPQLAGASGGVRGDGCSIRALARSSSLREDVYLLPGCALFPLDLRDGELIPSPRIPEEALIEIVDGSDANKTLWADARARVALRFGDDVAKAIDQAMDRLRTHRARGIHLKTLK